MGLEVAMDMRTNMTVILTLRRVVCYKTIVSEQPANSRKLRL
jgi:hypothetical protein